MHKPLILAPLALAVPLALSSFSSSAAEPVSLDTTTVTASSVPARISDLPRTVWVIENEALQEQVRAGVPLKEVLGQLIPGMDIGPQGRTNYGQNLRGRSVQVMIDGVSLNGSRSLSRQFDAIDPFNIERIEVLSGASAVYGGGATGGIVNIITKRGSQTLQLSSEVGLRSGFHDGDLDWRVAQSVAGGNEQVSARLGVVYQRNGAAYDAGGTQVKPDITQTDLQYNQALDVLGNVDIALPRGQSLKLAAQFYDSGYEGDKALYLGRNLSAALAGSTNTSQLAVRDGFKADLTPRTRRTQGSFDYQLPDAPGGQTFYLQGSTRSEALDFNPFPGSNRVGSTTVPYYSASRQQTDAHGLKAVLLKAFDDIKLHYGVEVGKEDFDARQILFDARTGYSSGGLTLNKTGETGRYPAYSTQTQALFANVDWTLNERWASSAGVRHQRTKIKVGDFVAATQQTLMASGYGTSADSIRGGQNDYAVTLFNAGLVFKPASGQRLYLNYAEGFELPDPAKYYGQGNYTLVGGNSGRWQLNKGVSVEASPLQGIKTRQLELGWHKQGSGWQTQLAAFYALSNRDIVFDRTSMAIQLLDQRTRNYGVEGDASVNLGEQWRLGGNFLAIKTEKKENGRYVKQDITSASPSKLTLYTGWQHDRLNLRLQGVHSFGLNDSKAQQLHSYTVADLLGSYQLPHGTLSFGVQNLFNRQYTTIWGQRAKAFYGSLIASQVVDFQGRGRTLGASYSLQY